MLLAIITNITCATFDWFCGPGHIFNSAQSEYTAKFQWPRVEKYVFLLQECCYFRPDPIKFYVD